MLSDFPHSIFLEKLEALGLGWCSFYWVKDCGWPVPEGGDDWSYVQLVVNQHGTSPGLTVGASPVLYLYQ